MKLVQQPVPSSAKYVLFAWSLEIRMRSRIGGVDFGCADSMLVITLSSWSS